MSLEHLTLFLDTNTLLHYPPMAEVDWLRICDAKRVTLMLCLLVIQELDEKKHDSRLGERAARAIREIKASRGHEVRPKVFVEVFNCPLRPAEFPASLSHESGDDQIVHLVMKYREKHPGSEVAVYSEDYGMCLRCEAHQLSVIEPDKSMRLPSPLVDQDRKHKATLEELNRWKVRLPKLYVRFADPESEAPDEGPFRLELTKCAELQDPDRALQQERLRLAYLHATGPEDNPAVAERPGDGGPARSAFYERDVDEFKNQLEDYYIQFHSYIIEMNRYREAMCKAFRFAVVVSNDGSSPAQDLDVYLHFPPVLAGMATPELSKGRGSVPPEKPEPPSPPWTHWGQLVALQAARVFREPSFLARGAAAERGPTCDLQGDAQRGFTIEIQIPSLKHYRCERFEFTGLFKSWEAARPFEVESIIGAANLPERKSIKIPVIVSVLDSEDTMEKSQ